MVLRYTPVILPFLSRFSLKLSTEIQNCSSLFFLFHNWKVFAPSSGDHEFVSRWCRSRPWQEALEKKLACALREGRVAYTLSPGTQSDPRQSWASVSAFIQNGVDSAVPWVCCPAHGIASTSSWERCGWPADSLLSVSPPPWAVECALAECTGEFIKFPDSDLLLSFPFLDDMHQPEECAVRRSVHSHRDVEWIWGGQQHQVVRSLSWRLKPLESDTASEYVLAPPLAFLLARPRLWKSSHSAVAV